MDIHQALNWRAIWPVLQTLDGDASLALLDAGCGGGAWCRRLARRRSKWQIVGLDQNEERLQEARTCQSRDSLPNLRYVQRNFMDGIGGSYDVILSIASIHYAVAEGRGSEAMRLLAEALKPGGKLILLVPRRANEQPVWPTLPRPQSWPVFGVDELESLLNCAGLTVTEIRGLYGRWCVLGKQTAMWAGSSVWKRAATAPLLGLVRMAPLDLLIDPVKPSYALRAVVTAR